ncbi:serine/threonine protein kinae HT1-like [Carpediemonas membranifera]|uniref:Serine/threonine protein kinae HT1-like n=1 Tax=Carpediemonas membranifera TaxID=201153 RepID=A0A8J6EAR5_9EUKA|nr:serine/threonine protein kinae HT1-like [Carpediemonas membranifera]|eukprot:KAG9395170.1 serine/threonine protein kinae HT1-like [Carpediemonas membranifera]
MLSQRYFDDATTSTSNVFTDGTWVTLSASTVFVFNIGLTTAFSAISGFVLYIPGCKEHRAIVSDNIIVATCLSTPMAAFVFRATLTGAGVSWNKVATLGDAVRDFDFQNRTVAAVSFITADSWTITVYKATDATGISWTTEATFTSDATNGLSFGAVSLDTNPAYASDQLAVSEIVDGSVPDGAIHIYQRPQGGSAWTEVAWQFDPHLEWLSGLSIGVPLALQNDTLAFGADDTMCVFVFNQTSHVAYDSVSWGIARARPTEIALDGDSMLITIEPDDQAAGSQSTVTVLGRVSGSGWYMADSIISPDNSIANFGQVIAQSGNKLAIGTTGSRSERIFSQIQVMNVTNTAAGDATNSHTLANKLFGSVALGSAFGEAIVMTETMLITSAVMESEVGAVYGFLQEADSGYFNSTAAWSLVPTSAPNPYLATNFGYGMAIEVDDNNSGTLMVGSNIGTVWIYDLHAGYPVGYPDALTPTVLTLSSSHFGTYLQIRGTHAAAYTTSGKFTMLEKTEEAGWTMAATIETTGQFDASHAVFVGPNEFVLSRADGVTTTVASGDVQCVLAESFVWSPIAQDWSPSTNVTVAHDSGLCFLGMVTTAIDVIADGAVMALTDVGTSSCCSTHFFAGTPLGTGARRWEHESSFNADCAAAQFTCTAAVVTDDMVVYRDVAADQLKRYARFYDRGGSGGASLYLAMGVITVTLAVLLSAMCTGVIVTGFFTLVLAGRSAQAVRKAIIRSRLRKFAKAELTKLGVDSSNKLYSAIFDFFIAPEKITETEVIAAGGFGSVSRAVYKDQVVCIKKLHEAFQADATSMNEFAREAKTLVELSHPNVLKFLGATVKLPAIYIVTEFCALGSLTEYVERLRRQGRLTPVELLDLVIEAADGLAFIHSRGIVHRDIKPDNFFVSVEEKVRKNRIRVKVGDLGLAVNNTTKTMTNIGTMGFAAPELLQRGDYDQKADVFSFAMTIYALFSEELPFASEKSAFSAMKKINDGIRPEPRRTLTAYPALMDVVTKLWDQEPKNRPTMKTAVKMLRGVRSSMAARVNNPMQGAARLD